MLKNKTINFSITGLPNYQFVHLEQINISNPFSALCNENDIVITAKVFLDCYVTGDTVIELYYVDTNSQTTLIDKVKVSNSTNGYAIFNLSKMFYFKQQYTGSFILKNTSLTGAILQQTGHYAEIEYHNRFALYKTDNVISNNINNEVSYYFDCSTQDFYLKRTLADNLTKFDISICYSSEMQDSAFLFMPKGWKFSFLDYLIINRDINDEIESIFYIDKDNIKHQLELADNSSDIYYAIDGSGIIIKELYDDDSEITTYELFSDISTATKSFNYDGLLILANDINGNYINVTYSTDLITVEDNSGNEITIEKNNTTNKVILDITLENVSLPFSSEPSYSVSSIPISFELAVDANNRLTQIEHNSSHDSAYYNSAGLLYHYASHDLNAINMVFNNGLVTQINEKHNDLFTDKKTIEYDYLKYYVTNRYGIKVFYALDKELRCFSNGEQISNEEVPCFYSSSDILVSNVLSNVIFNVGKELVSSGSSTLFTISGDNGDITSSTFKEIDSNNPISIVEGSKYVLMAYLTKSSNIPLIENVKDIYIKLLYGQNEIVTLRFDSVRNNQVAFIDFISPTTITSSNSFTIKIYYCGLQQLGYISLNNISIVKLDGNKTAYYASGISGLIYDSDNPIEVDEIDWYQFTSATDPSGKTYSFSDLIRNYLNVERNNHLFWSNDGHELTYNEYDSAGQNPSPNGGYLLRTHRNISGSNIMYAKKTWIKDYVVDGVTKEIYEFSYVTINESNQFELITIENIGDDHRRTTKVFDDILNLLSETDINGVKTSYQYKTRNNNETHMVASKTVSLDITNPTETYVTSYTYDTRKRLKTETYTIPGQTSTKSHYYAASSELQFATIDEEYNLEELSFDTKLEFVKKISNSFFAHQFNHPLNDYYQYMVGGDSTFNTQYQIINYGDGLSTAFYIKMVNDGPITEIFKTKRFVYQADEMVRNTFSNKKIDIYYDAYGRCYGRDYYEGQNYTDSLDSFYYFDEKPADLENYNNESYFEDYITQYGPSSGMNAKLYKVFDYVSNRVINYDYYSNNQLKKIQTKSSSGNTELTITYIYDFLDRYQKTNYSIGNTNPYNFSREVTYDSNFESKIVEVKYTIGNRTFKQLITYDDFSRIDSIENGGVNYVSFSYAPVEDNDIPVFISNPTTPPLTHSSFYMNKSGQFYIPQNNAPGFVTYDKTGNITAITYGLLGFSGSSTNADRYTYDSNDRITKEKNKKFNKTLVYSYDLYGNISSIVTKSFDESNTLSTETFTYSSAFKHKLISFNGHTVSYDSDYNVTDFGSGLSFSYSRGRYLTNATYENDQEIDFRYNNEGVRIIKDDPYTGLHKYYLEGNRIIAEDIIKNNTTKRLIYLYGIDGVFGLYDGSDVYYFVKNQLGDVIELRYAQAVYAKYSYDAFGNCTVTDSSGDEITDPDDIAHLNPFRYRSYYYDRETDLYYCVNRYYSPKLRRWMSMDNTKYFDPNTLGGMNLYAYCLNNPIRYVDPEGKMPQWVVYLAIGFVLLSILGVATIATSGAAAPLFLGALSGGAFGFVFGGLRFDKDNPWSWDDAAKGFMWGTIGGAALGATSVTLDTLIPSLTFSKEIGMLIRFLGLGTTGYIINKTEKLIEKEESTFMDDLRAFVFSGVGAVQIKYGSTIMSLFAGFSFAASEGILDKILERYGLTYLPHWNPRRLIK